LEGSDITAIRNYLDSYSKSIHPAGAALQRRRMAVRMLQDDGARAQAEVRGSVSELWGPVQVEAILAKGPTEPQLAASEEIAALWQNALSESAAVGATQPEQALAGLWRQLSAFNARAALDPFAVSVGIKEDGRNRLADEIRSLRAALTGETELTRGQKDSSFDQMRALETEENDDELLVYKDADGNVVSRIETFLSRIDRLLEPYLRSQEMPAEASGDEELTAGYTALAERSRELLDNILGRAVDVLEGEEKLY